MATRFFAGVSGFSYPGWKGMFYPKDLKSEEFLGYYSSHLESVEVNSSFYAAPKPSVVENWSARATENFRFSFKAPQQVTHILKLGKGAAEAAERFSTVLDSLGPRRGPVLFQLPPYAKQDLSLLAEFLSESSGIKSRVFEFRHESWFQDSTYHLLEENETGFCIAETEDLEPTFRVTGGIAYFRLRKDSYDAKAVDSWAGKILQTSHGVPECYVYLRHDESGQNALLAHRLSEKLKGAEEKIS